MKLNMGGGLIKKEGFTNVDILKGADIKHDLNKSPYPFKDNSIEYIYTSHTLEHLKEPELFFNEVQRILKKGGRCEIIVPHYKYVAAYSNFGHRGFYDKSAIDNVCMEYGHIVKTPFKLIEKKIIRCRHRIWKPKEIRWVIEK
ncbi:unnamed protein product [marine sediment metagenome]|uniref:Methyltransferase type 11 domain-containing protein n=1 Tax=marine sediment metagenome TaxID=412755 RepID=X0UG50_9ZZZZ